MFGIGALLIVVVYVVAATLILSILPSRMKVYLWVAVVGGPISFPYWHYLYPSFHEFQKLCDSEDRSVVKRIQPVDFLYEDGCYSAYTLVKGTAYRGYECSAYRPKYAIWPIGEKHYFRFTPNSKWDSQACKSECVDGGNSIHWDQNCQAQCFDSIEISEPSFKYKFHNEQTPIVEGRLYRSRIAATDEKGEEMSVLNNYSYFPYGNGMARILGMASGDAPSLSCKYEDGIYKFNFLKPLNIK